jgi:hypothetical protein
MIKRVTSTGLLAILFVVAFTLAARGSNPRSRTWTGYVNDPSCGDPYTIYDKAERKEYVLDGADLAAAEHAGQTVEVSGTLDGNTIHVQSIR